MKSRPTVIFFDIDGTLLDDESAVMRGLDALHANYGSAIGHGDHVSN